MTTDGFFSGVCDFIKAKTGIEAIWANQQARNPNSGKAPVPGQTNREARKYILCTPIGQNIHRVHKIPDPADATGNAAKLDMYPIEVRFNIAGIDCKNDELRPVWYAFNKEDYKSNLSPDWSILSTGELMNSPMYDKGEWRSRTVFEVRALIYDVFKDPDQFPITGVSVGPGVIYDVTGPPAVAATLHIVAGTPAP